MFNHLATAKKPRQWGWGFQTLVAERCVACFVWSTGSSCAHQLTPVSRTPGETWWPCIVSEAMASLQEPAATRVHEPLAKLTNRVMNMGAKSSSPSQQCVAKAPLGTCERPQDGAGQPCPPKWIPKREKMEPPHQLTSRLVMCIFLQGVA